MNGVQFTGQGWAMQPEVLRDIAARKGDLEAVATKQGAPLPRTQSVEVRDGVAVVAISGPLFRYANLFTQYFGGSSIAELAKDFQTALGNSKVKAILLDIDSPGGQVAGVAEFAKQIRAARKIKPILAYTGGSAASGAYWIASAASRIYASETAILGSIGVVSTYIDRSKADEAAGIRRIEVVSSQSPDKRLVPTDDRGLAAEQAMVDDLAQVFINSIAENRGVTPERVISDFGGGGVLVGQKAVAAGLADGLGDFESVLASLAKGKTPDPQKQTRKADFKALVSEYQAAQGSTLGEAMLAVARTNPEAYKAHEFGAQEQDQEPQPTTRTEAKAQEDNSGFMALVSALEKNHGMTRVEAIREAARRSPESHRRYVQSVNPHLDLAG